MNDLVIVHLEQAQSGREEEGAKFNNMFYLGWCKLGKGGMEGRINFNRCVLCT